tara:strand:+ start:4582 stop:6204 length:1623 start_codon:yes stop_codon:yes gene_type:complete
MFNLDGSIVRFYHLLLILLQFQLISLAHSTTELGGSINFNAETLSKYITHSSVLAENWKMDQGGSSTLVPGGAHQQYGSSAFKIIPKFSSSKLTLSFFSVFMPMTASDLSSCNFYILADRQKLLFSDSTQVDFTTSAVDINVPQNTKSIEVGILPSTDKTFTCNLRLSSIAIEERPDNNDLDGDAITNDKDNCPTLWNPNQIDTNFDNIGDSCTFDRSQYFSSDMPTECISSSSIGPDNDADGVSDLCDSDDDNDTISDLNELHWGMDVFTAFDFDLEQETDHDKDGLMSSDEIGYGYSPFIINKPPIVKLDGFFLNHKNSVQTPNSESILVYQYASINNQTFSFGSRHPNYHYELNEELLLTGTSVVDEGPIDFKHEFQPAIRIFPSPVLVSHEYKRSISVTAIETDNITGKTVSIPALVTVISKVVLSDDGKNLGFNYLLHISNKNTSDLIIRKLNEPTIWNVTKGIIGLGELDNYTSLVEYIPPGTKPETVNPQSSESSSSNKSGGAFHFIFVLTLFAILKVVRLDKPYLYVKRTRN